MKRNIWMLMVVLCLTGIAVYQSFTDSQKTAAVSLEEAPQLQFLAPSFQLQTLKGSEAEVGGPRNKPLLLNFWASWCGPCELEAPYLQQYYEKYKDEMDVYAVNVTAQDKVEQVKEFVETYHFSFPILMDKEGDVSELYRIRGIPTTYLIDRNGVIQDAFNFVSPEELEKKIKKLIRNN